MALTRDQIRAADTDAKTITRIPVPQWGGDVCIRRLTVREEERFWDIIDDVSKGVESPAGKRGAVVMMACINEDGSPLFAAEDADWLGSEANKDAVQLLATAIRELSGVSPEAQTEIEKKPEQPTSSPSTGSPTDGVGGMSSD
jgi:hypothetical protein